MAVKFCRRCQTEKDISFFHKAKREKDGHQSWCKECQKDHNRSPEGGRKEYHRKRYHEKKDEYLEWSYKRHYGIGLQEYNQMLEQQNFVCAICHKECNSGRRLAVDHNHSTGKVRSLLCGNCNKGLGAFKENPQLIQKAIEYLEFHNGV